MLMPHNNGAGKGCDMRTYKMWGFCTVTACILLGMLYVSISSESLSTFQPTFHPAPTLIIDAGHGGEDGGAVSLSGAYESNINLAIAKRLDGAFTLLGYPTIMLRTTDISLHENNAVTIRQKKVSDLKTRVKTVNSYDNAVLISIHQNSYPGSQYHGAQVFYSRSNCQELALAIQQAINNNVDSSNTRQIKQIPDNIYLFKHVSCPAILVECGFLTNPQEEKMLQDPSYQNKLAATICAAYLNALPKNG